MHAHDVDPSQRAQCTRGHRGGEPIGWSPVDDATERGLTAGAKEHRVTQIAQGAEESQGDQVLGGTLPEAKSRVEDQLLWRDAKRAATRRDRRHLL